MPKYIEPRIQRDFGSIISAYFSFIKGNIKDIINLFFGYNIVFLVLILFVGYYFISAYYDSVIAEIGASQNSRSDFEAVGMGMLLLFVLYTLQLFYNYALSSSYLSEYERKGGAEVKLSEVHRHVIRNIGKLALMMLIFFFIFMLFSILSVLILIIPFFGFFAYPLVWLMFNCFTALTIQGFMYRPDKGISFSMNIGWSFTFQSFWKSLGVNFTVFLLMIFLGMAFYMVPSLLATVYVFHDTSGNSLESTELYRYAVIIGFFAFSVFYSFAQVLMQFANGFLYYSAHEKKYNIRLRAKIQQLGTT